MTTATAPHEASAIRSRARVPTLVLFLAVPLVALVAVVITQVAAGDSSGTTIVAGAVSIKNFQFTPSQLTVKPGAKVTVTNADTTAHTFSAQDGSFTTGKLAGGASKQITAPTKPGTYTIYCKIHTYMNGKLVVKR